MWNVIFSLDWDQRITQARLSKDTKRVKNDN